VASHPLVYLGSTLRTSLPCSHAPPVDSDARHAESDDSRTTSVIYLLFKSYHDGFSDSPIVSSELVSAGPRWIRDHGHSQVSRAVWRVWVR
jgi:hypothetical protein